MKHQESTFRSFVFFCSIVLIIPLILVSQSLLYAQDPFTKINPFPDDTGASNGIVWGDYNNDGFLDIFISNGTFYDPELNYLYQSDRDGTFTKILSGDIALDAFITGGATWGDFDNDGDLDLYVTTTRTVGSGVIKNILYENDGTGTFTKNTTAGSPVVDEESSATCAWGDYNNDGYLDIFVKNGSQDEENNSLYSSDGDATFTKIMDIDLVRSANAGYVAGCAWADYDRDGDLDLLVLGGEGNDNYLWRNDGSNVFTKLDIFEAGNSMGCSWGDYDNDGDLDLFITNSGEMTAEKNLLYRNDGGDTFTKITSGAIANDMEFSTGSAWGDFDNDGDLDLWVGNDDDEEDPSSFYVNNGNGTFTKNTSSCIATDPTSAAGAAWADYNKDGFLDLLACTSGPNLLFKNRGTEIGNTNHWFNLKCIGSSSNKSAIGTKVRVKATINSSVIWQMREISAQTGYASHNSLHVHFGLGDATIIEELKLEWPSGTVQSFFDVPVDEFVTAIEGEVPKILTIESPNGGEDWKVGYPYDITWTTYGNSGNVKLEFSTNGGGSWTTIVTSTPDDGSYSWVIPNLPTKNCRVRVSDTDGDPVDVSDGAFTISGGTFVLTMVADPTEGGTTDPTPGEHVIDQDLVVNISATPNTGWEFTNWIGGNVADPYSSTTTVTMDANKTVTANFKRIEYTLTMAVNPTEGGTTNPAVGDHSYYEGTVVNISATAEFGWEFSSWSGDVADPNSPTTTVTMNSPKTVTANFQQIMHTLTMAANPEAGGTTNPPVGDHSYAQETNVEIIATPAEGYVFVNWTGDVADANSDTTTVTINSNKTVTANFSKNDNTLTMKADPTEGGTTDPPPGDHIYDYGTVVDIAATPNEGYEFVEWNGDVADPNSATTTVTMTGDKTVIAFFTETTYTLTMAADPSSGGVTDPPVGKHNYAEHVVVNITATPNTGWEFVNWTGGNLADPNSASTTVTMNNDMTVTAHFSMIAIEITDLRASVQVDNILLEWTAPDGVSQYNVYRGTSYDFEPDLSGGTNRIAGKISDEDAGTEGVQWTDSGNGADVVGDVTTNYFYRVTAITSGQGAGSSMSVMSINSAKIGNDIVTGTPHTAYGKVFNSDLSVPPDGDIKFNSYITTRPNETLNESSAGCSYEAGYWNIAVGNFPTAWAVGEILHVDLENIVNGETGSVEVKMTSNGSDGAEDCILSSESESKPSNVAGEFDYNLITTGSTDINELVILMDTQNTRTPIATAEQLAQAIPNCTDVYYWSASGQGTIGHPAGTPIEDFPIYPGHPYIVNVTSDVVWTVAGSYSNISFGLITTNGTDINHIGIPLGAASITNAEELGQDIPNCTDVYYWSASGQGTIGHPMGTPVENFPVYAGFPYYVNVTSATTWPAGGEQAGLIGSINIIEQIAQGSNKSLVAGKVPHTVYGKLICSDDLDRKDNRLKLRAWVAEHPDNILTDENIGVGCDGEFWWVAVSNFANNWKVGDSLQVEIIDPVGSLRGEARVVLTAAGSDKADPIHLSATTSVAGVELEEVPKEFVLLPNYPNPFNPETKISFGLPQASHVKIRIYDISGRLVRNLVDNMIESGYHQIIWNGQDNNGEQGSSGIYLCRMEAAGYQKTLKLIFAK